MVHDLLNTHDHLQEGRRQNCGTCTKNEEKVTSTKEREQKETTKNVNILFSKRNQTEESNRTHVLQCGRLRTKQRETNNK